MLRMNHLLFHRIAHHNTTELTSVSSSKQEPMDLAKAFNDAGCVLFQMGNGHDAYEVLCGALQALHHSIGGKTKAQLTVDEFQRLLIDPSVQRAFDSIENASLTCPLSEFMCSNIVFKYLHDHRCTNAFNTSIFLWNEPFCIGNLEQIEFSNKQSSYFGVSAAMVYFNLALLLHKGLVVNSKRQLERALTYYSLAGSVLFRDCPRTELQESSILSVLVCGILNNMGFLLHTIGDMQSSRTSFNILNRFLSELGPPKSPSERTFREEFGLNILSFHLSLSTAAAA